MKLESEMALVQKITEHFFGLENHTHFLTKE